MPIARIKLPDGRVGDFRVPEGTTPEQARQFAMESYAAGNLPSEHPVSDITERLTANLDATGEGVKALGVGALKGVAGLGDLMQQSVQSSLPGKVAANLGLRVPGGHAAEAIEELLPKPAGAGAAYMHSIGEMIPGAGMMGGGLFGKGVMALGSGVGAEAAGRMSSGGKTEGQNPIARIAGALAGGLPAIGGATAENANKLIYDAAQGTTPEQFTEARRLAKILADLDMPSTNAQLFGLFSRLPSLQARISENPSAGAAIVNRLKDIPERVRTWGDLTALDMGNAGQARADALTDLQTASEGALAGVRGKAGKAYQDASPLPFEYSQDQMKKLYDELMTASTSNLHKSDEANAIRKLAGMLVAKTEQKQVPVWETDAAGHKVLRIKTVDQPVFETDSQQINQQYKNISRDAYKISDDLKALPLKEVRQIWKQNTPEFQPARDAWRKVIEEQYNPMSRSLTGQLARSGGGSEADRMTAKTSMFESLFPKAADNTAALRSLAKDLRGVDPTKHPEAPEALQNAVTSYLQRAIGAATDKDFGIHGGVDAALKSPAAIRDQLVGQGGSAKSMNFQTALEEVAKSQGKNPRDVAKGFQTAMDAMATYSNARVSNELSAMELARTGEGNVFSKIIQPGGRWARAMDDLTRGKAYREVAAIFLSPKGIDKIEKLSKFAPGSPVTRATIADLINAAMQVETENSAPVTRR